MNDKSYKETIQLPDTDFSNRANLTEREPRFQEKWDQMDLYQKMREKRQGNEKFILHDGPPYANGDVHIGTALNKILKDIVVRFQFMQGYDTPFVPGWDCHGLPIEWEILQELGEEVESASPGEIRRRCQEYAEEWLDVQRNQFRQLGCVGDWENPYLTMDPQYEESIIEVFQDLLESGHIYRRKKTIHWCMECRTALASAELEYTEKTSPSIFARFQLEDGFQKPFDLEEDGTPGYVVIWTTTPWTLPANMATAVHPDVEYALVRAEDPYDDQSAYFLFAADLVEDLVEELDLNQPEVQGKVQGKELEGLRYSHPFIDRECSMVLADYVDLEEGTGCVHTAPGHGEEDYHTGLEYGIDPVCPVDESGTFTDAAGPYSGLDVYEANPEICSDLRSDGVLLGKTEITHEYPHCWRCDNPVIFRATRQWFVDVDHDHIREEALVATGETEWIPDWGQIRMESMLRERPDWCISRQRYWGVPIPVLYCEECNEPLLDSEVVEHTRNVIGEEGSGAWFEKSPEAFIPEGTTCSNCNAGAFKQETDIFDVWFESGSSHCAVVEKHPDLSFPADLYLEGTDQHRGWFQVSLLPSVIRNGSAPYETVVTNGFVVNEEGRKISKSDMEGLSLNADTLAEKFGSDILRLWVASVDFTDDVPVSEGILQDSAKPYKKLRRTFRYLLGNLQDFDPEEHTLPYDQLEEVDKWVLHELADLIETARDAYDEYEFHQAFQEIHNFCVVNMSNFFLDVSKDRFYCAPKDSRERRSAQTVSYRVIDSLCKLIAPMLVHTAEDLWEHIPSSADQPESVHLADWPEPKEQWKDPELEDQWDWFLDLRGGVYQEVERLRENDRVNQSLEIDVTLYVEDEEWENRVELLDRLKDQLSLLFLVSEVNFVGDGVPETATSSEELNGIAYTVEPTENEKCQRCWNYRPTVGEIDEAPDLCERCHSVVS